MALEEALVGQHAQAGLRRGRIAGGDLGGQERVAQHALAGAGLLDLGDHRRAPSGDLGAQGAFEAAQVVAPRLGVGAQRCRQRAGQRPPLPRA
jgi:hypothetical protein